VAGFSSDLSEFGYGISPLVAQLLAQFGYGQASTGVRKYKSIGTRTPYFTGTIATSGVGNLTVTLTSGTFDTGWGTGDKLTFSSLSFQVLRRDSDTQLTLEDGQTVPSITGSSYSISRVYTTIAAWELAERGDLVTTNEIRVGVCYADSVFNETLVFDGTGMNINSGVYRVLSVAQPHRHLGRVFQGAYVEGTFTISEPHFVLEHLRFTHPIATAAGACVIDLPGSGTSKFITLNSILIHDWFCTGDDTDLFGVRITGNGGCRVLNTLVNQLYKDNTEADSSSMAGIYIPNTSTTDVNIIANSTVVNLACKALFIQSLGGIGVYDNKAQVINCIDMVRQYTYAQALLPN
jgi:hypothetical protein